MTQRGPATEPRAKRGAHPLDYKSTQCKIVDFEKRNDPFNRVFSSKIVDFQKRNEPQNRVLSSVFKKTLRSKSCKITIRKWGTQGRTHGRTLGRTHGRTHAQTKTNFLVNGSKIPVLRAGQNVGELSGFLAELC